MPDERPTTPLSDRRIDRRAALKLGALAAAAAVLPAGCGRFLAGSAPGRSANNRALGAGGGPLRRVRVAPERVIRTVTGLRPFRPSGFVVRAERLGEKTLIHNYGHGGCGVTLSWGTARLALDHALAAAPDAAHRRAAVLGAGAVGLATARLLQEHGFDVTIYAKALPPDTTSNIAGAFWSPVTLVDRGGQTPEFGVQLAAAARFAHRRFQLMAGERYGVRWLPTYYVGAHADNLTLGWTQALTPELYQYTLLRPGEHPFAAPYARLWQSMLIEPSAYLPAVLEDVRIAGGRVVVTDLADASAVARLEEPVVVNCTGLGARDLFGDAELVPIKGQLTVLVPQAEVDYMTVSLDHDIYMFPRHDGVILGGTHERGQWALEPNEQEGARLLTENREFFESMVGDR